MTDRHRLIRVRKQRWSGLWMVLRWNGRGWVNVPNFLKPTFEEAIQYASSLTEETVIH